MISMTSAHHLPDVVAEGGGLQEGDDILDVLPRRSEISKTV